MDYYAHVSEDGFRCQTVAEHLTGTAALCHAFAGVFGAEAEGELMGLAHDIGKCTDGFQKRRSVAHLRARAYRDGVVSPDGGGI